MAKSSFEEELTLGLKIRLVETKLLELFRAGLLNGTVHTCVGQELTGIFVSKYLRASDYVFSNHRGHGHYIARTNKTKELILELMGKKNGSCHGIGGSQHLYDKNYLSNGIQGGLAPIAAGVALHFKCANMENISIVYIGDGTLGEGVLYEAFNISGKWNLPILYVLENNGYAQSTSQKQTFSGNMKERIEGFGISYGRANIWDLENLDRSVKESVFKSRSGKPTLLEIDCYRLNAHSKGDDNRKVKEIESFRLRDPINRFVTENGEKGQALFNRLTKELNEIVEAAVVDEDLDHIENLPQFLNEDLSFSQIEANCFTKEKYNERIYAALKEQLAKGNTFLLGEDIEGSNEFTEHEYGGAFKVTRDLSDLFPGRVLNTPISEAAITGVSIGLAICGNRAFAEIMFGDFVTLIFDQILQQASKFYGMTQGNIQMPLVIRTPMGGYRGYGPTHSQSLEKHFMGIPYLNVIALNKYLDPKIIYNNLNEVSTPTLVIENKILYTKTASSPFEILRYEISNDKFPTIKISPKTSIRDFTIVCYGGMLDVVERAVYKLLFDHDIFCEIIVPSLINNLNIAPIIKSLKKTKKLLVVEEGSNIASFSGTLVSALVQDCRFLFQYRTIGNNTIIPSSYKAELSLLPSEKSILDVILINYYKENE